MTDIMKLADDYIAQLLSDVGRQYGFRRVTATTDGKARAALQSAIEALQGECAEHKENAIRNARQAVAFRAERDALQAENERLKLSAKYAEHIDATPENQRETMLHDAITERDALQAENELLKRDVACHDDMSNEIAYLRKERDQLQAENERLKRDIDRQITAFNAVADALNKAAPERDALQAKLDELQRQEPVAHCRVSPLRGNESTPRTVVQWVKEPAEGPLYAAPKALEPLTDAMRKDIAMQCAKLDWDDDYTASVGKVIALAEAAHGITKGTPT